MRIIVIGANSYIAKNFMKEFDSKFEITAVKRDENFKDYFDINPALFENKDAIINFAAIVHKKDADKELYERINAKLPVFWPKLQKREELDIFCSSAPFRFMEIPNI